MAIHHISIKRDGDPQYGDIRRVVIQFADDRRLELRVDGEAVRLHLGQGEYRVVLDANGPGSSYEQAVNLLRLHLPQCRQ